MKKLLTLVCAVLLLTAVLSVSVFGMTAAAETKTIYYYNDYLKGVKIFDVDTSLSGDVVIPETLGGRPVIRIDNNAFSGCREITGITIPDTVTEIGDNAFSGCYGLTDISIPNSVTNIGKYAFANTGIKSIAIPESVTSVGNYAFSSCTSLRTVTIPDSVTNIGDGAFENCYEAVIHCNTSSYAAAYAQKRGLPCVYMDGTDADNTVSGSTDSLTWSLNKKTGVLEITDVSEMEEFSAGSAPWYDYSIYITAVHLPDTLTKIGAHAFEDLQHLKSAAVPEGVTSIGEYAFAGCYNMTSLTLPDSVTKIGSYAFYACEGLAEIHIPNGVTHIEDHAFSLCGFTSVTVPESVTEIGDRAFENCFDLKSVNLPDSVTEIGHYAFSQCSSLTDITIPDSVTDMGRDVFSECSSLQRITVPGSVKSIGECAFKDCTGLTEVTLLNGVTEICDSAFEGCTSLAAVTIPESVTTICDRAFFGCESLREIALPDSVTEIGEQAFEYCKSFTSFTIPNGVTTLSRSMFFGCESLTAVTIPNSVTTIEWDVFNSCTSLKSITVPKYVSEIPSNFVGGCTALESVLVYSEQCTISKYSFLNAGHTFYGFPGSAAEAFAAEIGAKFIDIMTVHAHTLDNGTVTKEPTCKAEGVKTYTCKMCSYTETETVAKTAHKYDAGKVTTAATCKAEGVKTYTCTGCQHTKTESIAKRTTHTYTNACDKTCNVCKAARTVSHTYKTVKKAATASANGYSYKKCSVCAAQTTKQTYYKVTSFKLSATAYTYDGKVKTPTVTVKDCKGKTLKKDTDYTVTYAAGRKNAGTYKVTVTLKGNYSGTKTLTFKVKPIDVSKCKVSAAKTSYTYDGKVKTPAVTVKTASGTVLKKDTHYTVKYAAGRKNVGTYKVTVTMKGNYTGTKILTFKVLPKAASVKKLTAKTKGMTVTLNKVSSQATGYEIQYSTAKTFKSAKTKIVKSYKTSSASITGLTAKKTYYVRVRTYKTVDGKKVYSAWSAVKSVKTK